MLDTYISRTNHNTNIKVEQANVHDAARLLSEVEYKAQERFTESLVLKDNFIEGKCIKTMDMRGPGIELYFKVNGKPFSSRVDLDTINIIDAQAKTKHIIHSLANDIALEMLLSLDQQSQMDIFR